MWLFQVRLSGTDAVGVSSESLARSQASHLTLAGGPLSGRF